jgi:hypothetical protein
MAIIGVDVLMKKFGKDNSFLTVETSYCIDTTFRPEGAKYTFPPKVQFLREYFSSNTVGANSQDTIGTDQSLYPDLYILYEEEAPLNAHISTTECFTHKPWMKQFEVFFKILKSLAKKIASDISVFQEIKSSSNPLHKAIQEAYNLRPTDSAYLYKSIMDLCYDMNWWSRGEPMEDIPMEEIIRNLTNLTVEEVSTAINKYNSKVSAFLNYPQGHLRFERTYSIHTHPNCEPDITWEEDAQLVGGGPNNYMEAMYELLYTLFFKGEKEYRIMVEKTVEGRSEVNVSIVSFIGKYQVASHFEIVPSTLDSEGLSSASTEEKIFTVKEVILATECI